MTKRTTLALLLSAASGSPLRAQAFEQQMKFPPAGTESQMAGYALAADGDVVVAGAPGEDSITLSNGAVFVFRLNPTSGNWKFEATLYASDPQAAAFFGTSVAIDGDRIAVGAPGGSSDPTPAVYVFRYDATTQQWSEEQKLTFSAGVDGDRFGAAIALRGDLLLAGAPYASVSPTLHEGVAVVFRDHGSPTGWVEEQTLVDPDRADDDEHGFAVAVGGATASAPATVMVGSPRSSEGGVFSAGSVGVWTESGGTWTHSQELVASSGAISRFGHAIDLQGERAAFGAPWEIPAGSTEYVGAAYVFARQGSTWSEELRLPSPIPLSFERFGNDVALTPDGATLLVGAPSVDSQGTAWLFRRGRHGFVVDVELRASDAAHGEFGSQAALTDEQMIVANPDHDTAPQTDWGALYFFDEAEITLELDPETPAAGAPIEIECHRGDPGDLVLLVIEELNGTALFRPILLTLFSVDYAHELTVAAPDPLLGVRVGMSAWKISPTGPLVGSSLVYVDV